MGHPHLNPPAGAPLDPFFVPEEERTVFAMPSPGGRSPLRAEATPAASTAPPAAPTDPAPEWPAGTPGLNPLLAAAHPLLMLVPRIRATARLADPLALKDTLAHGIRDFEARARAAGLAPERVLAARYVLCTALDEAAGSTPWGGAGQWARHNLLVAFHDENVGGVKVFELMARLAEQPAANRDLLEFIHATLALGFEGHFAAAPGGRAQLDAVRERLAGIVRAQRGDPPASLADHWAPQPVRARPWLSWLPLWVSGAVTALALLGAYLGFAFSLDARSDPLFARIQALPLARAAAAPAPAAAPPAATPRLAALLQPEVDAGRLEVRDDALRSTVTLRGDTMFEPGSATPAPAHDTLLRRVAEAAAAVGGAVLVTGHTDSQPIRSLRFPSNWQLSQARADAVRTRLVAAGLPAARVRAEGRADGEPRAGNDSAAGRAANRRIEVIVAAPEAAP